MKETLLLTAALLIILLMVFQTIRGFLISRRIWGGSDDIDPELSHYRERAESPGEARQVLREIDARAVERRAERRSKYFSTAGDIALTVLKRPSVAIRYYVRALRNNPRCEVAFDRLAEILLAQKKYRRFERTCWDLLSRLDDDSVGEPVWKKCWSGLVTVYSTSPRYGQRADAIRKMLDAVDVDADANLEDLRGEVASIEALKK